MVSLPVLIAAGLVVILAILWAVIASRPAEFRIERSAAIRATPDVVFSLIHDFHHWSHWSPWDKLDPQMEKVYGGPPSGQGATYAWKGNKQVGEGRMTILTSEPVRRVGIRLEFLKPFAATNDTTFELHPTAEGTRVTWSMEGRNNFMAKAFNLLMNMDKLVGRDFERGLANLDAAAQTATRDPL